MVVIHENFFKENFKNKKSLDWHEISFYYFMKSRGSQKLNSNSYTCGVKEEMHWISINDLDKVKAFPSFLKVFLNRNDNMIEHIVTDERS